jgi:hypothetical protein
MQFIRVSVITLQPIDDVAVCRICSPETWKEGALFILVMPLTPIGKIAECRAYG